uniref:MarR family transcriptional regulator n=1 Tax=Heterorhabditis bacteriophora TaxID=37862 RepID=A0A1I7XLX6_HETBA
MSTTSPTDSNDADRAIRRSPGFIIAFLERLTTSQSASPCNQQLTAL